MGDLQIVPVYNKVEAQYVEMMVPLYSYGCEKKVKRALSHLKGIYSVKVDYYNQKVTVWGICNKLDVLAMVKKKRKEARFWNVEEEENNNPESVDDCIVVKEDTIIKTSFDADKSSAFYTYSTTPPRFSIRPPMSLIRTSSFTWKAVKKRLSRKKKTESFEKNKVITLYLPVHCTELRRSSTIFSDKALVPLSETEVTDTKTIIRTRSGRSTKTRSVPSHPIPIAVAESANPESDNDSVATTTEVRTQRRPRQSVGESSRPKQNTLNKKKEEEENDSTQVIDEEEEENARRKKRCIHNLRKAIQNLKECVDILEGFVF
ncbi:unnamed protein product [Arabidopsis thaliana]|uniref:HMA domain-containing protein n=1 Tax=Arabidopsis thaliana TaxID=3702 RepID=A0A654FTB3_ARATH|nr:unnamed protein product [Arabidopsis thaliana]